jgi:hypothetical protein
MLRHPVPDANPTSIRYAGAGAVRSARHHGAMPRRNLGERILAGRPGYSVWDDGKRFALKYPLGTTHVEWDSIEGRFQARPDGYVTFELARVDLVRRNMPFRLGVRLGRLLHDAGMRISASQFRMTTDELAELLNDRLTSHRVGRPV